jgi:two-component system chemotaxis response regulator CheB
MPPPRIIVIGTSAGGVAALRELLSGVARPIDAAIFVVLHMSPSMRSHLSEVLQSSCALPIAAADDDAAIEGGRIYVCRPDYHLMLDSSKMRLTRGPRENRSRPAIDVLFRSAAQAHGPRVVGVILTGALDDGTAGLWSIKDRGGVAIVQDPAEAEQSSMPESALAQVQVDHVLRLGAIGPRLMQISGETSTGEPRDPRRSLEIETAIAREGRGLQLGVMELGATTPYTCPECHGVMVKVADGPVPRFRCHTGHAFTISTLMAEVTESVEARLWDALRGIEEGIMLLNDAARHLRDSRHHTRAAALEQRMRIEEQRADDVRAAVLNNRALSDDPELLRR